MDLPLLEDDSGSPGVIEPWRMAPEGVDMPERAVLCFFADVLHETVATQPGARHVTALTTEAGTSPVWEIELAGKRLAVLQPGVGAPWAAASLEEVVAMGCRQVIACGAAGALTPELVLGHAVVVDSAVRDEGTSYHYLPPARTVHAADAPVRSVVKALESAGIPHSVGRSWSTDAIYRETRERVQRRVDESCVVVEMEAAALLAVARYRGVDFGQVLLAGDTLAGDEWQDRGWRSAHESRTRLFWAAAEAAVSS